MEESCTNFREFFKFITELYSNQPAIFWRKTEKNSNGIYGYDSITGNKLKELVYLLAKSLDQYGLKPGDKAAIISETRFEWVIADFACIAKSIITVPVYSTMTSEQIRYILEHSECRLCFVSGKLVADKVNSVINELPKLKKIITFSKPETAGNHIVSLEELMYSGLIHGSEPYSEKLANEYFDKGMESVSENDILTIIYTSGTTGTPKGVMLTHGNVLANIKQCTDSFPVVKEDRFLSFLPLAHTYERTAGYYLPLTKGAQIYYAENIDTLSAQMAEVKPTIVLAVPILFTRIQTKILKNIESLPLLKKIAAKRFLKSGMKHRENKKSGLWKLADKKVFKAIREKTGGEIKFFISGGSALNKETAEFFDSIGVLILQGYGMTEASPVISVNRINKNKFGTVGLPLEGLEVKIAGDGEILVRGGNVMPGYFKNESDTLEMISDNWLYTGDIGEIDSEGFLKITDRKKSLIKTAGGRYISLTHIEESLEHSEYIEQAIAFASDEKHFVTALIVPDFGILEMLAKKEKINYSSVKELIKNDKIIKHYEREVKVFMKHVAKYEKVRKFSLLDKPFTIESGELTPTLKLKRKVIEQRHGKTIKSFYEN